MKVQEMIAFLRLVRRRTSRGFALNFNEREQLEAIAAHLEQSQAACNDRNHDGLRRVLNGQRLPDPTLGQDAALVASILGKYEKQAATEAQIQAAREELEDVFAEEREDGTILGFGSEAEAILRKHFLQKG